MTTNDIDNKKKNKRLISWIAMVIITAAIIVWFLPRTSGPQFRYDVGKPWMYSSMIAKFDFPIYKALLAAKASTK